MDQGDRQAAGSARDCHSGEIEDILAASTRCLIAIGAASALNRADLLRHLIPTALTNGILAEEVAEALAVASEMRTQSGVMTDDLSATLIKRAEAGSNTRREARSEEEGLHESW